MNPVQWTQGYSLDYTSLQPALQLNCCGFCNFFT